MLFSDIMFIGVDGIDAKQGLTCTNASEAEVLRTLVHHAKMKVVVASIISNLGTVSKYMLCPNKRNRQVNYRYGRICFGQQLLPSKN